MKQSEEGHIKILCVDDEPVHLNLLKGELEDAIQAKVVTAEDGLLAFKKARNEKFDLIITDYRMPRLDGNDLITALRETEMNDKTPILIYTGFADSILKEMNTSYKRIDLVEKPCETEELVEVIERLMSGRSELSRFQVKKEAPKTDLNFLNSFIEATNYTLEQMAELRKLSHEKPFLFSEENLGVAISANITMKSPLFTGILGIGLQKDLFLKITSEFFDEEQTEINKNNRDAAGELINIIYGQTKLRLNELGFNLGKAIPSIVVGEDHQVYTSSRLKTLVVPFSCEEGDFFIFISLESHS